MCATGARGARTLRCGENDYKVVLHRFPGARGARTLRCGENDYKVVLHRFPGAHLGLALLATTEKSKKNLKNIIDI